MDRLDVITEIIKKSKSKNKNTEKNASIVIVSDGYTTDVLFNGKPIPTATGIEFRVKAGEIAEFDLSGIALGVMNSSTLTEDDFWEFVSKILGYTVRAERERNRDDDNRANCNRCPHGRRGR